MEPTGSSDMDDSPKGERAGASESIEVHADAFSQECHTRKNNLNRSRREWSRRESSDIDEARQGERAGASESIEAQT